MIEAPGFEWLAKAVAFGLGQLAVGTGVVREFRLADDARAARELNRWFARRAVWIAALLVAAILVRAWAHTVVAFGAADTTLDNVRLVALESRWGGGWRLQLYAALVMTAAAALWRGGATGGRPYALAALAFVSITPALGHAAGDPARHVLHAAHHLASALWIGSLAMIAVLAFWPPPLDGPGSPWSRAVPQFSPLALAAAATAAVTGTMASVLYVGSFDALLTTAYGRTLLVKLAAVSAVVVCGWLNWRHVRRRTDPSRATMLLELTMAAAVLLVTGVLTETEHP